MSSSVNHITFAKYHGTGNDFIMIDHYHQQYIHPENKELVSQMCSRHFGIGSDGLILLEKGASGDFYMNYFNADGRPGSFCGNGSRCAVAFAKSLGIIGDQTTFFASDGRHEGFREGDRIFVKMGYFAGVNISSSIQVLDTGSPHYVSLVNNLDDVNVYEAGKAIRFSPAYRDKGINVNFIQWKDDSLYVKTYERGVEDVTLSCGTGVTAAAIAYGIGHGFSGEVEIPVTTMGGMLSVRCTISGSDVEDIWLGGPATRVFEGTFPL